MVRVCFWGFGPRVRSPIVTPWVGGEMPVPSVPYSLMQSVLLEKALLVITSEQYLVNVISRRVRQLMNGHRPMVETGPRMGFADIALTEVIEKKLSYEATEEFVAEPIAPRPPGQSGAASEKKAA